MIGCRCLHSCLDEIERVADYSPSDTSAEASYGFIAKPHCLMERSLIAIGTSLLFVICSSNGAVLPLRFCRPKNDGTEQNVRIPCEYRILTRLVHHIIILYVSFLRRRLAAKISTVVCRSQKASQSTAGLPSLVFFSRHSIPELLPCRQRL